MKSFYMNWLRATAAAALLFSAGCDEWLDVEPTNAVDTETAFNSAPALEAALTGAYAGLQSGNQLGGDYQLVSDLLAVGEVNWQGTFANYRQIAQTATGSSNIILINNASATGIWTQSYNTIARVNRIIANLNVVADPDQRARIEAEARFIRGVTYFYLVRFYGLQWDSDNIASNANNPAVPLLLVPGPLTIAEADAMPKLPRASVAAIYDQVFSDLLFARDNLPALNNVSAPNRPAGRAGSLVASAFLMRVYMQQNRYQDALNEALTIINSGAYSYDLEITPISNDVSREAIFEIQNSEQDNPGTANSGLATFYAPSTLGGRGDARPTGLATIYAEAGDRRRANWFVFVPSLGRTHVIKWSDPTKNYPVIRLQEVVLSALEMDLRIDIAAGEGANDPDAQQLTWINQIRTRAGLPALVSADGAGITEIDDKNELLVRTLRERRRELIYEGVRIWDLRRWADKDPSIVNGVWSPFQLLLPVPEREILTNDQLLQNDEYTG